MCIVLASLAIRGTVAAGVSEDEIQGPDNKEQNTLEESHLGRCPRIENELICLSKNGRLYIET